jgi:hypothetical protein
MAPAGTAQSTCTVAASTGTIDTTFNAMATQNGPGTGLESSGSPGWTGGDSTYSVQLGNGNTAFFYSDSYIGQSPTVANDGTVTTDSNGLRTRTTDAFYAHNGIVVRNASTGDLTTTYGAPSGGFSRSYFVPASNDGGKYWMGDSVLVQTDSSGTKKVWTFLLEFNSSTGAYMGSAIAQLSPQAMTIDSITPLSTQGTSVMWGSAMSLEGSYGNYRLYIYGTEGGQPYVALTNPSQGVTGVADMSRWFYAQNPGTGPSWTLSMSSATPILGEAGDPNNAGSTISNEFSVKKITSNAGTTFLLVAEDKTNAINHDQNQIVLYSACSAYGPFSAMDVVYTTPETGATTVPGMTGSQMLSGKLWTYNPHAHPQFDTNGNLVISYNVNSTQGADLIYADAYHARYIDVPIAGLP